MGDCDADDDVDLFDFQSFQSCFATGTQACTDCFDVNDNNTIDLTDYLQFHGSVTGPN